MLSGILTLILLGVPTPASGTSQPARPGDRLLVPAAVGAPAWVTPGRPVAPPKAPRTAYKLRALLEDDDEVSARHPRAEASAATAPAAPQPPAALHGKLRSAAVVSGSSPTSLIYTFCTLLI
jgi:hypothetical protein